MQIVASVVIIVIGLLAGLLICINFGWASVRVTEVKDSTQATEGVPFYEPRPYLLVTKTEAKDASSTVTTTFVNQIIWLPNTARRFTVQVKSGWGDRRRECETSEWLDVGNSRSQDGFEGA